MIDNNDVSSEIHVRLLTNSMLSNCSYTKHVTSSLKYCFPYMKSKCLTVCNIFIEGVYTEWMWRWIFPEGHCIIL